MFNLQSGLHRQRFPAPLTPTQAKRLQAQQSLHGNAKNAAAAQHQWAKGLGKHSKAVTGLVVDNLNRTVISCSLDGTVKVSSNYHKVRLPSKLQSNDRISSGIS